MINLGSGYYIFSDDIVSIFDSEILSYESNKDLIKDLRSLGRTIDTCDRDKIRSYLFCRKEDEIYVYTSSFKAKTLYERYEQGLEALNARK